MQFSRTAKSSLIQNEQRVTNLFPCLFIYTEISYQVYTATYIADLPSYQHLAGFSRIFLALPHPARIFEIRLPSRISWNILQFFSKKLIFPQNLQYFLNKHIQKRLFSVLFCPLVFLVLSPDRWNIDSHSQIVWTIRTTLSRKTGKRVFI